MNIMEINYKGNIWFTAAIIALAVSTVAAVPINFIPAKDAVSQLIYGPEEMTTK